MEFLELSSLLVVAMVCQGATRELKALGASYGFGV